MNNPAPFAARVRAFALDYLLICCYLLLLAGPGAFLTLGPVGSRWSDFMSNPYAADAVALLSTVLPVTLYFGLTEAGQHAASFGKRRIGLVVTMATGEHPGLLRSLSRSALTFLPWQMAHTAMFHMPGFPLSPASPPTVSIVLLALTWTLVFTYVLGMTSIGGHRTLYDRLTGTVVTARGQA